MRRGSDISAEFSGLYLVHQNVPGKKVDHISHASHILFIPLQGQIAITADVEYTLGPGHMLFLPANTTHSFDSSVFTGERLIVMMNPKIPAAKGLSIFGLAKLPLSQLIKEILFYLLLHPKTNNAKSLVGVMIETLSESLQGYANSSNQAEHMIGKIKDERVRKIVHLIQENLADKVSIEALAKQAGLSSRNLNRLMLQEIGLTPKQFLITARIEKAQVLLRESGVSVTEVAFEVGYNSLSQFIAAFRAQTGQLPSEVARLGRKPKI